MKHQVGFDGGKRWGKNQQHVEIRVDTKEGFTTLSTRYENMLSGWIGRGARHHPASGVPYWGVTWPPIDGKQEERKIALPADLPIYPTYLVSALVELLPRTKGACHHYRPLNEGMGTVGLASALYVAAQETIEHDGAKVATWRVELRALGGGTRSTWWVDDAGHALRIDYGGAQAQRSTRERVLAGLPAGVKPKAPADKR